MQMIKNSKNYYNENVSIAIETIVNYNKQNQMGIVYLYDDTGKDCCLFAVHRNRFDFN